MPGGLDFEAWYASTSERAAKQRAAEDDAKAAAEADRAARKSKDAVAFNGWVGEVSIHDRALELIPQLSGGRFSDDEAWRATATCLAYIESCIMDRHKMVGSDPHANPLRSMEHMFATISRKNHTFDVVTISGKLASRFSKAVRNSLEADGDNFTIGGVGYAFMQRAPDAALVTPMSSDDKLRNGIFSSMVKKAWAKASEDVQTALSAEAGADLKKRVAVSMRWGMHQLDAWVEEDLDTVAKKKMSDYETRRETGRSGHARWLELKETGRIKVPTPAEDEWREPAHTRMDCMAPKGVPFRKIVAVKPLLQTSADMVRSMGVGLKSGVAYALSGSRPDLERSRRKLIADGFIYLENFSDPETGEITEESRAAYQDALRAHAEGKAREAAEKKARDAHAFGGWVETKEGAELAREVMSIMPVVLNFDDPTSVKAGDADHVGGAVGTGVDARSVTSGSQAAKEGVDKPLLGRAPTDDEFELWRAVGYASKAVSRSLLPDYLRWSAPLFSKSDCIREWSSFHPANHEADMVVHRAQVAEEERQKAEAKEKVDRALGIKPRPKAEPGHGATLPGGGSVDLSSLYKAPNVQEPETWTDADRKRALKLLQVLATEHRKMHKYRETAKNEQAPVLPVLRRRQDVEKLPEFIHGHEGAVKRLQGDLAIAEGRGLPMLGGYGVGAEIVLQWFVGEDDVDVGPKLGLAGMAAAQEEERRSHAGGESHDGDFEGFEETKDGEMAGTGVEGPRKLVGRMHASAAGSATGETFLSSPSLAREGPQQPPYVIVVETCGVSGSKKQRDGDWTRVCIDPPEAMAILTSTPGTGYVPISARGQGVGSTPPIPGKSLPEWDADPRRLHTGIRITGLLPNTSYGFRARAYSRAGASAYTFGVFTTAAPPPPAPIISLPSLVPRHLLSVTTAGTATEPNAELTAAPSDIDAVTLCWERRIDFRTGLLHFLRVFYFAMLAGGSARAGSGASSRGLNSRTGSVDGAYEDNDHVGVVEEEGGRGGASAMPTTGAHSPATLFTTARVSRAALLSALQLDVGLRNWLMSCLASVDKWPENPHAVMPPEYSDGGNFRRLPARFKIALTSPVSVLEALVRDKRASLSWEEVSSLFEKDSEADDAFDLLLAGTRLGADLGLGDEKGAGVAGAVELKDRPTFSISSGGGSVLSLQRHELKKGMTVGRVEAKRPATAQPGGNLGTAMVPRGLPPSGSASARPRTAGGDLTQQLSMMRTKRRGSLSSVGTTSSSAVKALAASMQLHKPTSDVTLKYSLLQCLSDGPHGQEWQEVFVGIRSMRRVDKLLHGTSYAFKVQAVNQDGQGSLFGPTAVVTTALPPPVNPHIVGRVSSTSVRIAWEEVSSANALTSQRALAPAKHPGEDEEGGGSSKGADIDAVLQALLAKTKAAREPTKEGREGKRKSGEANGVGDLGSESDPFASLSAAMAIREGDGGVGVDLMRSWARYDTEGTGTLPVACIRGLLADLGAYSETTSLINAAADPRHILHVASGEGAASAGPGEWRLHAALSCLDPRHTGVVPFGDFVDWWNAVDAAVARARGISLADQLEQKQLAAGRVAGQERRDSTASAVSGATFAGQVEQLNQLSNGLHKVLGDNVQVGDLSFAIVYVVECRRLLSKTEAAAIASGAAQPTALKQAALSPARPKPQQRGGGSSYGARSSSGVVEEDIPEDRDVMNATARTTGSAAGGAPAPSQTRRRSIIGTHIEDSSTHSPTPGELLRAPLYSAWTVVYMGPATDFTLHDLLPNGEYQFRVSALGRHAYSAPSKLVTVNLPPLAPFAPVLIKTDSRGVVVRWYPGELGADKFEVQAKIVDTLRRDVPGIDGEGRVDESLRLKATVGTGAVAVTGAGTLYKGRNISETVSRRLATSRHYQHSIAMGVTGGGDLRSKDTGERELWMEAPEEAWATMYTGTSTAASLTGMYANSVYHIRVVAYNAAGVPSRPSCETQLVTPGNGAAEALTVANASRMFVVECPAAPVTDPRAPHLKGKSPLALQDAVLGDTVLFTEDVFVDGGPEHDPYHPVGPREVPESHPKAQFLCSRTIAGVILADSASGVACGHGHSANLAGHNGPVPVGVTATAYSQSGYLKGLSTSKMKTVTGREIVSVRPASATVRRKADAAADGTDSGVRHMGPCTCMEDALSARALSLQVEFCTVSKTRASGFAYPHGAIVKRSARDLAGLDMYRMLWEDEAGRWSLAEEMRATFDK